MTSFIHTADWQIGKPYRQIADEQKRFKLQQERLTAIGRIRDAARMQGAAFVVVAGDLFDSPTPRRLRCSRSWKPSVRWRSLFW